MKILRIFLECRFPFHMGTMLVNCGRVLGKSSSSLNFQTATASSLAAWPQRSARNLRPGSEERRLDSIQCLLRPEL